MRFRGAARIHDTPQTPSSGKDGGGMEQSSTANMGVFGNNSNFEVGADRFRPAP